MKAGEDNVSCFSCAILTHGDNTVLTGVDGQHINTKALIEKVASIPGLSGKPKLFFIQVRLNVNSSTLSSTSQWDYMFKCIDSLNFPNRLREAINMMKGFHSMTKVVQVRSYL